jgi:hypothetical protein
MTTVYHIPIENPLCTTNGLGSRWSVKVEFMVLEKQANSTYILYFSNKSKLEGVLQSVHIWHQWLEPSFINGILIHAYIAQ